MKTAEDILLDYMGGKKPITEHDKKFYRVSVDDCLKLMQQARDNALQEAAEKARVEAFRLGEYDPKALNNFGYRVNKESILSLQIKD